MEQSVHRPLSKSGLPIVRRVNSAIGERVGLDLLRRPRRPVVTDSSIDPPTRPNVNRLRCCGSARASLLPMPIASARWAFVLSIFAVRCWFSVMPANVNHSLRFGVAMC